MQNSIKNRRKRKKHRLKINQKYLPKIGPKSDPTFGGNRLLVCPEPILDRFWADVGCFSGDFSLNFDFIEEAYVGRFWDDFWLLITYYLLLITYYLLPITFYLLVITYYLSLIHYLLFIIHYLLFIIWTHFFVAK